MGMGEGDEERKGKGEGELLRLETVRRTIFASQMTEFSLKIKPPSNCFINLFERGQFIFAVVHQIWSAVAFLSIFQIGSGYSIYQRFRDIKVYKELEENADELSQKLPFSKEHFLGITTYFYLVPLNLLDTARV